MRGCFLLYILALFLGASFAASDLKNYGAKCKWKRFLVIDIKYPCPIPYQACEITPELQRGCKKFDENNVRICCTPEETTTISLMESLTTTAITTASAVPEEENTDKTESNESSNFLPPIAPPGMCGIYPPQEAEQSPCLGPDFSQSTPDNGDTWKSGLFVVPSRGTFKSAECLCNLWGGELATGPFEGSDLKLIRHCTKDGIAWINVENDACLAIHSNTQKIQWFACESFLPSLCRFKS
jgi:hypothetical protein